MSDYDQQFDYLIQGLTKDLCKFYLKESSRRLPPIHKMDTSPLLNMTISVFASSLINVLDFIKSTTIGEIELMENIELYKKTLVEALTNLPCVHGIKEMS